MDVITCSGADSSPRKLQSTKIPQHLAPSVGRYSAMTGEKQTASKEIEGPVVDETQTLGGQGNQERPPRGRDDPPTRTAVPQRVPSPQPQRGTSSQAPQGTRPEADQVVTFRQLTNILSNFQESLTATLQQQLRAQAVSVPSTQEPHKALNQSQRLHSKHSKPLPIRSRLKEKISKRSNNCDR